jgi:hypothetical protein
VRYDDEDDDRPRRKKRRKEESGPPVALIVGILAGVFILIGVSVGMFFALRGKAKPGDETVQQGSPPPLSAEGLGLTAGPAWVDFQHPEGLFTAKTHVKPVHFGRPEGGSVFAPTKAGFFNACTHLAVARDLQMSMEVRVYPKVLTPEAQAEENRLAYMSFMIKGTRKTVTWAGREAVEDKDVSGAITIRRRVFIGNRLYAFTITGLPNQLTEAEIAKFFDSFKPQKTD